MINAVSAPLGSPLANSAEIEMLGVILPIEKVAHQVKHVAGMYRRAGRAQIGFTDELQNARQIISAVGAQAKSVGQRLAIQHSADPCHCFQTTSSTALIA